MKFSRQLLLLFVLSSSFVSNVIAAPVQQVVLYGTTGACRNVNPGGPCTEKSTLVQLDPATGALINTIGPVGFTVNGLAWDARTGALYGSTPPGDVTFHGLIVIDVRSGAGRPVHHNVVNFGLDVTPNTTGSPIHSIAIDSDGNMVGWYDEFPPPDTFVRIDEHTGIATEFRSTINTSTNGLAFDRFDVLWNINSPVGATQTAYVIEPTSGTVIAQNTLSPPTNAALGDFNPADGLYYGLNFDPGGAVATNLVVVDPYAGTVTEKGATVDNLHVIAFVKPKTPANR